MQHSTTPKQFVIQQFFLSFVLMVLIVSLAGFYHFVLSRKVSSERNVFTILGDHPSCLSWYGKISVEAGSICLHQYPDPDLYTHADVEFWNFAEQRWEGGSTNGYLEKVEILRSKRDEFGHTYPLLMRCTWGCAVGKYDEYLRDYGQK